MEGWVRVGWKMCRRLDEGWLEDVHKVGGGLCGRCAEGWMRVGWKMGRRLGEGWVDGVIK